MRNLYLGGNQLSGSIPPEVGNITLLEQLDLAGNQLSGSIPFELGNLNHLYALLLNDNQLEGDIPEQFWQICKWLMYLDLNWIITCSIVPPGYPVPGDPLHDFLNQKDPNWQLYQGFEQVIGSLGGELTSLDSRTNIIIPPGAVITDTTFTFIPHPSPKCCWIFCQYQL